MKHRPKTVWYTLIATCFYVGRFPRIPGSISSLLCYPLYYTILETSCTLQEVSNKFYLLLTLLILLGLISISYFQKASNTHDDQSIVIDEVIGQTLTIAISLKWLVYIADRLFFLKGYMGMHTIIFTIAFILFRYFDIRKPFVIGYVNDRIHGAMGVILDDILAAFFASGIIYIFYKILAY